MMLAVRRSSAIVAAAGRRSFAAVSSDLTVSEMVPPNSDFASALEAFTFHKILGNRLGYAWRADRKAEVDEPRFHYDRSVTHLAMLSPLLSDRFVRIDFRAHSLSFLEVKHPGVTEENLHARWAEHLRQQGFDDEVERVVRQLEDLCVRNAPQGLEEATERARAEGRNVYLQVRELLESQRTLKLPGDWLTAFKRIPWPNSKVSEEAFAEHAGKLQ